MLIRRKTQWRASLSSTSWAGKKQVLIGVIGLLVCAPAFAGTYPHFDGVSGAVNIDNSTGSIFTTPYTVEAWVRPTHLDSRQDIIYKWGGNQRQMYFQLAFDKLEFVTSTNGLVSGTVGVTSATSLTANQWTHIAGVFTGTEIAVYINGVKDPNTIATTQLPFQGTAPIRMGGGITTQLLQGGMDEVRVSSVARYTENFVPSTINFPLDDKTLMLFHFDEGSGSITSNPGSFGGAGQLNSGVSWSTGSPVDVPEPGSICLIGLAVIAFNLRRTNSSSTTARSRQF